MNAFVAENNQQHKTELKTCDNSLSLENSCIYYARQTREIYQVLPYSVDFKAPQEFWNPLSKTVLGKFSFFLWNKRQV